MTKHAQYIFTQNFLTVFSTPYILTKCLTRLERLTESQLTILKEDSGWLQLLMCRGRDLRPLIRKITCNQKNNYNNAVRLSGFILLTDTENGSATQF